MIRVSRWNVIALTAPFLLLVMLIAGTRVGKADPVPSENAPAPPSSTAGPADASPKQALAKQSEAEQASDVEEYGDAAYGPTTPTPLDEAVAAINIKVARYTLGDVPAPRLHDATRAKRVVPLTADDVVRAIQNWDRTKRPVPDATYQLFQRIAKTKMLPPHSELQLTDDWFEREKYEVRVVRIDLDAMTGKNRGYTFVIREHEIDRGSPPRPGYRWLQRPRAKDPGDEGWRGWFITDYMRVTYDESEKDALVAVINRPYDILSLQVVAFDDQNKRYDLDRQAMGAYGKFLRERFRLDPKHLPVSKVKYIGIEAVERKDVDRNAAHAVIRAKAQRVELLPLPKVGAYDFSIVSADKLLNSRNLRGKVVLIDLWTSYLRPCLKHLHFLKTRDASGGQMREEKDQVPEFLGNGPARGSR